MTVGAFFFFTLFLLVCLFARLLRYRVLPGFSPPGTPPVPCWDFVICITGFYWVLIGFTGFYWVFTGVYWVFIIDESIMSFYHLFLLLIVLLYTRRKYFFNILFRIEKDFVTEFLSLGRRLMLLYRVIFQWKRDVNRTKEKAKRNR